MTTENKGGDAGPVKVLQPFAKIFETRPGQLLVVRDSRDGVPTVTVSGRIPELGEVSGVVTFASTDEGEENADRFLAEFDQERAELFANEMLGQTLKALEGVNDD